MADNQVRRQPPPAVPYTSDLGMRNWLLQLNRWFLDLSVIISTSGGIDPGQLATNVILNGAGVPVDGSGNDGDLYLNNTGANGVIYAGLAGEGSTRRDVSGDQLYGKIAGHWSDLV